jgi:predicted dehydrogenase
MDKDVTFRFGLVGLSSDHVWQMGDGLAAQPDVQLVAAADADSGLSRKAAARWGLASTFSSQDELLAAEKVDALLVCCDNAAKADVVESAARRGVHVYMDKPLAASPDQARRIETAVRVSGIVLMIAYHHIFYPLYEASSRVLHDGLLGNVYLARGAIGHSGPREFGCSDEFCAWLFDADRNGGGCFADEGCYVIAEFIERLGRIVEVSAFMAQIGSHPYLPPEVEDNAVVILRFSSGGLGVIDAKWGQVGPAPIFTSYHGVDGTLSIYAGRAELAVQRPSEPGPAWEPTADTGSIRSWKRFAPHCAEAGWGGREQRLFLDHLRSGEPVEGAAGLAAALHVQEVIDAAYKSVRTGRSIRIPELESVDSHGSK